MARRQKRIAREQVSDSIEQLTGQYVHIVLENKNAFYARILGRHSDELEIEDMIKGKHKLGIKNITEIILDL